MIVQILNFSNNPEAPTIFGSVWIDEQGNLLFDDEVTEIFCRHAMKGLPSLADYEEPEAFLRHLPEMITGLYLRAELSERSGVEAEAAEA